MYATCPHCGADPLAEDAEGDCIVCGRDPERAGADPTDAEQRRAQDVRDAVRSRYQYDVGEVVAGDAHFTFNYDGLTFVVEVKESHT